MLCALRFGARKPPFFLLSNPSGSSTGKQGFGLDSATERFDVGDEQHWAINVHPSNVFLFYFLFAAVLVPGEARQDLRTGVVRLAEM